MMLIQVKTITLISGNGVYKLPISSMWNNQYLCQYFFINLNLHCDSKGSSQINLVRKYIRHLGNICHKIEKCITAASNLCSVLLPASRGRGFQVFVIS